MVRLGKRKVKETKTEAEQMQEEIIGSPGKALFGDDPHEAPKIDDPDPAYWVQVCSYKKESKEYKVLITKDAVYSKLFKKQEKRTAITTFLQVLMRKDLPNNFYLFKYASNNKSKDEDIKNYGADFVKVQKAFEDAVKELRAQEFVEQFVDHSVSRTVDTDQIDSEISAEAQAFEDVPLGQLAKSMFNIKGIEQAIKSEGVNINIFKQNSPPETEVVINSALNIFQRIKECLDTSQYSDVAEAAIEGLSIKFYEKIPHTFDILEVKKYNLNSEEKIKSKLALVMLLNSFENVYASHARYRESIDFDSSNALRHFLDKEMAGYGLASLSSKRDIGAIDTYFKRGLTQETFSVSQVFSISSRRPGIEEEQDSINSSLLWLPCRVENLQQNFRDNFEPKLFSQAMDNLQGEGCSYSLFDSAGAAIASVKRNIPASSLVLVLCQVRKSDKSPVVSQEEELEELRKEIVKKNVAYERKKIVDKKPNHYPTILEGRYRVDLRESTMLEQTQLEVPTGRLVLTDAINSDFLFGKTVVYSAGWIMPRFIVKFK